MTNRLPVFSDFTRTNYGNDARSVKICVSEEEKHERRVSRFFESGRVVLIVEGKDADFAFLAKFHFFLSTLQRISISIAEDADDFGRYLLRNTFFIV